MSDLYDEGKMTTVPEAMDFLVNGIFCSGRSPQIYHHVYIDGECYEIIPKSQGFTWLYEAALPYVEAVFYRTAPFRGTKSYNAQAGQVPADQKRLSLRHSLRRCVSGRQCGHSTHFANARHAAFFA